MYIILVYFNRYYLSDLSMHCSHIARLFTLSIQHDPAKLSSSNVTLSKIFLSYCYAVSHSLF